MIFTAMKQLFMSRYSNMLASLIIQVGFQKTFFVLGTYKKYVYNTGDSTEIINLD